VVERRREQAFASGQRGHALLELVYPRGRDISFEL
jgi:hypothetical protein